MARRLPFLILPAQLLAPLPAQAQDAQGDAVNELDLVRLLNVQVSTATKTTESVDEAPAIITVVTREEIARWGYRTVAEVLEHTVGFYLVDDHILPDAGVRGMTGGLSAESGFIKVMIDGRSVAYRTTSGNWLGVELIPLGSVEQIEIIRGPASALYGADAFLGVVNVITARPPDVRPLRLRATAGSSATNPAGSIDVVVGGTLHGVDLLFGVAAEQADRSGLALPEESPAPNLPGDIGARRVALNLERESVVLQGRLGHRAEVGELWLSAYGSGIRRGGDFAQWAQLTNTEDGERGTVVALQQLRLNLDGLVHADENIDLSLQGTYFQGGLLPDDRVEIASDLFYVERRQSYRGFDAVFETRLRIHEAWNAIAGVETIYDHEQIGPHRRVIRATGVAVTIGDAPSGAAELFNLGAFLSFSAKPWAWLKLTAGVRYDHPSEYEDQVTGRIGATSRLSDVFVAKLLYGSAFKAPSPYLLYSTPLGPGDVVGSQDLEPQLVHTVEGQVTYRPKRWLALTTGLAQSWLLDKAEFRPQGINQAARNVASQRSLAWETRADLHYYDDVRSYASFEWVWSERDLGEGYVADLVGAEGVVYPDWIGRAGLIVAIPSLTNFPLELGGELMLVGERRAADTSIVEEGRDLRFDPYALLDVSLATREVYLAPGHESRFALRARNMLLSTGPNSGPVGFEYPLRPGEIFIDLHHAY